MCAAATLRTCNMPTTLCKPAVPLLSKMSKAELAAATHKAETNAAAKQVHG